MDAKESCRKNKMSDKGHPLLLLSAANDPSITDHSLRKRKPDDAFGRRTLTNVVGFTKCPLCGTVSSKQYALGRGIASHLQAIHTPWKPTKLAQKVARRQWEQAKREAAAKQQASHDDMATTIKPRPLPLQAYTPTEAEMGEWEAKVAEIVQQLEHDSITTKEESSSLTTRHEDNDATIDHPAGDHHDVVAATSDDNRRNLKLDKNGQPLVAYKDSLPPFLQAAAQGQCDVLKEMIQQQNSLIDLLQQTDRHGSTAEHWAAGGGHLDCLELLLEHRRRCIDASTHSSNHTQKKRRRRDGKTPLHYAARNGQLKCVRYLVEEQHYDIHETSGEGTTALHMACYGGHLPVVRYLVEFAAATALKSTTQPKNNTYNNPALATNAWGCTAAHWAAMTINPDEAAVGRLLSFLKQDCGVDFAQRQHQGHSVLHKAAQRKNRHVLEWMANSSLSPEELALAASPDLGGHKPSDIWKSMGGDDSVTQWMISKGW